MIDLKIEVDSRYQHIKFLLNHIILLEKYKDNLLVYGSPIKAETSKEYYANIVKLESGLKKELKYKINALTIDIDLINILKSNLILMVYNLTEYIVSSLLDYVYLEIEKYDYDLLKENIKKKVSKDFRAASKSQTISSTDLLNEIFKLSDIKKNVNRFGYLLMKQAKKNNNNLSGNVCYKTLDEISKNYCFDLPAQTRSAKHIHLENFKLNRNKLSHGNNSFIDIWKIHTTTSLEVEIHQTINYLNNLQKKVENYIADKEFLK